MDFTISALAAEHVADLRRAASAPDPYRGRPGPLRRAVHRGRSAGRQLLAGRGRAVRTPRLTG
jgi:hypothetical protein